MFVRVGPGGNLDEGLDNSASTEDLSARTGMGADEGRNNSTACKFGFLRVASLNGSNTVFRSRKTNKKITPFTRPILAGKPVKRVIGKQ